MDCCDLSQLSCPAARCLQRTPRDGAELSCSQECETKVAPKRALGGPSATPQTPLHSDDESSHSIWTAATCRSFLARQPGVFSVRQGTASNALAPKNARQRSHLNARSVGHPQRPKLLYTAMTSHRTPYGLLRLVVAFLLGSSVSSAYAKGRRRTLLLPRMRDKGRTQTPARWAIRNAPNSSTQR
ncbi:hypothetical protein Q31a_45220 [Aureliella helgolandensis]|uniref:Uncharacterized protein n=1 Tax=Aureliella helgolandensis TaxID=2527968 RepID=A0A518GC74_9BACT|nr:hypothetical protein Q31a_45220 [Aureliella helgolandensis]